MEITGTNYTHGVQTYTLPRIVASLHSQLLDAKFLVYSNWHTTGILEWSRQKTYTLALTWEQILNTEEFTITEKKTGKKRVLRLNPQLQQHIQECHEHIQPLKDTSYILVSQKGTVFTIQRINVILKEIKKKYCLQVKNFSCHSLRKTFGRQVYNMNSENSELALVKLMELFNHSSVAITKRYLGLRQEEILETYDYLTF